MSDKKTIQTLFNIFFRLESKDEVEVQAFTIRNTLEKLGYYEKYGVSTREQHTKSFDNYYSTLGINSQNPSGTSALAILQECLHNLE